MQINKLGCFVMAAWVVAFIFYMYIRITKTMDLGQYLAYGIYVLVVEVHCLFWRFLMSWCHCVTWSCHLFIGASEGLSCTHRSRPSSSVHSKAA